MQKQFVVVDKHSSVPTENDFIAQTAVAEKTARQSRQGAVACASEPQLTRRAAAAHKWQTENESQFASIDANN